MVMKEITVTSCLDCPFSGWSTGGHKAMHIENARIRLQHHCNLQPNTGSQYSRNSEYSCFKDCPLLAMRYEIRLDSLSR